MLFYHILATLLIMLSLWFLCKLSPSFFPPFLAGIHSICHTGPSLILWAVVPLAMCFLETVWIL